VACDRSAFAAHWERLRFAERSRDLPRRLTALKSLAQREAARPGHAHLELGELLAARGELNRDAALRGARRRENLASSGAFWRRVGSRSPAAEGDMSNRKP
jgi:hypothetical protein